MNLINWIRQPALMWSFSTQKVGLSRDLFYAPSREHAKASILYHMDMMFGDDLGKLMWESEEGNDYDVLKGIIRDSDGEILEVEDVGYLKLVNDKIKTIDEVMDNYVELSEEEKRRKQERIEEYKSRYYGDERMNPTGDPEDYYGYPPRGIARFSPRQFEE